MARRYLMLSFLVLALSVAAPGKAKAVSENSQNLDEASVQEVVDGMSNKLVRGVANIATGWLELPKQIVLTSKTEGLAKGLTVGPVKGIGMTLVRTVTGVGEAATFLMAYPGFYEPILDPAYVWQKE